LLTIRITVMSPKPSTFSSHQTSKSLVLMKTISAHQDHVKPYATCSRRLVSHTKLESLMQFSIGRKNWLSLLTTA
jgi:hypothetical protein